MKVMKVMKYTGNEIQSQAWASFWRVHKETNQLDAVLNSFRPLFPKLMDPVYDKAVSYALNNEYDMPHFWDHFSPNQRASKEWLLKELASVKNDPVFAKKRKEYIGKRIHVYGGWFGYPIINMLFDLYKDDIDFIENIDMDEKAIGMGKLFNEQYGYNDKDQPRVFHTHANVLDTNPREGSLHLLINTSSEHMPPLPELLKDKNPKDYCLYALQSNNMFHIDDHINCVNDENELAETSEIKNVLYKGSLAMPNGYKRFMVIGYA